jgi:hypothetical protein
MDVIDQPEVVDPRQSLVKDPKDQEEDDPHQQGHGPVDVDDSKNLNDEEEDEVENQSEGSSPNDDEIGGGFGGTADEEWDPQDLRASKSRLDLISKSKKFTSDATISSSKQKRLEEDMQSSELQIVETAKAQRLLAVTVNSFSDYLATQRSVTIEFGG